MVARGCVSGVLHADDITRVLRHIELTPDVLVDVHATLGGLGIAVPATVWVALAVTVGITVLVGVLPGLVTSLAEDAVPTLLNVAG